MSKFFIHRPIFAWVIAIVLMVTGALAIRSLPIAQYPAIAPPSIAVDVTYPGASAKTLEDTVTQVIEQKMNGIDHLRYLASTSDSAGKATVTPTFHAGTNPDIARVKVQNKLQLALPLLPQEVQKQGVSVTKSVKNFAAAVAFVSTDGRLSGADLGDYIASSVQDQISRVPGVGDVQLFGAQYAMRVWLNPDQLNNYQLTPLDVSIAIQAQNAQVSAGQLGGAPALPGQGMNATLIAQTRLQSAEQFGQILLRVNPDGSRVKLNDVARIELGGESYETMAYFNGKPCAAFTIKLASGANALDTITAVRARLAELSPFFPAGVEVKDPLDTTPVVRLSIEDVVKTLVEAIALVFLVMYLFLQSFRATLIPTIAVPVVLLGTFGVLAAFGFSINTLTMFGVVLAIGLLVDDAIVVVENVERIMAEQGLSPKEATVRSMGQITGALVGIALVLSAVFVPMAFFGGSVGVIYRQFSITIVSAMALSVGGALVLPPALCPPLLKPIVPQARDHHAEKRGFFGWFNRVFERSSHGYQGIVGKLLQRTGRSFVVYGALVAVMAFVFLRLPSAFLPEEDQGFAFAMAQLPPGATQEQTKRVLEKMDAHFLNDEKAAVESVLTVGGFSFAGNGQNMGLAFIRLKPWDVRKSKALKAEAVAGRAMGAFRRINEAMVFAFTPPAVLELGNAGGFDLELQDRGNLGHDQLLAARNQLLGMAAQSPVLAKVRPNGIDDAPQYRIEIDQQKASALGLSLADINNTLSSTWGVSYVNDFIDQGRVKKVYVQSDAAFRMKPEDLDRWYVRNKPGKMVQFSAFSTARWTTGSPRLAHDLNGRDAVVAFELGRTGGPARGGKRGELHHLSGLVAHIPAVHVFGLHAERRIGLQVNFFHAALVDEVVDVGNTPCGRQRVVDVREREAERRGFPLVNFNAVLRGVVDTVRTHLGEHGTLRRHAEELIARRDELVVTEIAAVLQFQIESARIAEFQDGGRREGKDHRFVDPPERAHRAAGDGLRFQRPGFANVPGFEPYEREPHVLAVPGEAETPDG